MKTVVLVFETRPEAIKTCPRVDEQAYNEMALASNPYGDGKACVRIADILEVGTTTV